MQLNRLSVQIRLYSSYLITEAIHYLITPYGEAMFDWPNY